MHAILCSWFDVVKVLPLHEVFDLAVRFANRTSDPCEGFLDGGIMKRPKELAVCADAVSRLINNSSQ